MEVTGVPVIRAGQWQFFKKSTAHLFLKWHLLSIYSLSLWPARDTFHQERSTDIWNFALSHSKKSIQVSGDSPVRPLVTAGAQSGLSRPSSLSSRRQDFLRPPEHTLESGSLHLGDSRSAALRLNKIKYNRASVQGENGGWCNHLTVRWGSGARKKKIASSGRAGDIRLKAWSICCDWPLIFTTRAQTQNMLRIHIRTNILLRLHRFSVVPENKNRQVSLKCVNFTEFFLQMFYSLKHQKQWLLK